MPQQYLPTELLGAVFYKPSEQGLEGQAADRLARWRKAQAEALASIRGRRKSNAGCLFDPAWGK